jgi:hypothetical protein
MDKRQKFKIRKQVEVWKEDYEWYLRTHGTETKPASLSHIVNILLHAYRTGCENRNISIVSLADEAANVVIETLEAEEERESDEQMDRTQE